MGEGYGCSNYHFTYMYSALAITFIELPYHDVTPIFKRQIKGLLYTQLGQR